MVESLKNIKIEERDHNNLTLIAQQNDLVHKSGPQIGRVMFPEVIHLVIQDYIGRRA
jgi:hypothetical protein